MAELAATPQPALPLLLDDADHVAQKYDEAVTTAVEACADDTKGQTCYICTQALHWKTNEGLVRGCACRGTAGFAHVSCLAQQAKILYAEAEENNLDPNARWTRWFGCNECKQNYHGVVICALGWACWKTYVGRPERDPARRNAMSLLGNGLSEAGNYAGALSVMEAELSMKRRLGGSERSILITQSNLAITHAELGHLEKALSMERDVYSGWTNLIGEEHEETLRAATNYARSLVDLQRFEEAKSLMLIMIPVAQRVLGENYDITHRMRGIYATALYLDTGATLDDLREAVTTVEETARTARRVFGNSHPLLQDIGICLQGARAALRARKLVTVGAAVKLTGLSNGAFNGRRGIVAETSPEMRRKGRVKVIVDGRAVSVKGENLVVDAPTRSAADAAAELRGRIGDLGLAH